jgi:hypothetical protein
VPFSRGIRKSRYKATGRANKTLVIRIERRTKIMNKKTFHLMQQVKLRFPSHFLKFISGFVISFFMYSGENLSIQRFFFSISAFSSATLATDDCFEIFDSFLIEENTEKVSRRENEFSMSSKY